MSEPRKYRKKPVVIEAIQLTAFNMEAVENFVGGDIGNTPAGLVIATLEGAMHVSVGDYVIRGVQGEFYPCKPDIFAETYEDAAGEILGDSVKIVWNTDSHF